MARAPRRSRHPGAVPATPAPAVAPGSRSPGDRGGVGAALAVAVVAGVASSPGQSFWLAVFVDDMIAGTGLARGSFSVLYALATVCSALAVLGVGRLVARTGVDVGWLLVALGLAVACVMAAAARGPLLAFVALAGLRAFGQGSFPLLGTLLVAGRESAARGRALGALNLAVAAAGAVLPLAAVASIAAFGWRETYLLVAVVLVVVVLPVAIPLRRRAHLRPRAAGAPPDPAPPAAAGTALSSTPTGPAPPSPPGGFPWRDGGVPLLLAGTAPPLVVTAVVFHVVSLFGERGLTPAQAATGLGLHAIAGALGAVAAGPVVDRRGPLAALGLALGTLVGGTAVLVLAGGPLLVVGLAVLGLASGAALTASGAVWAHVYGIDGLGRVQGVGDGARIAGAAIGPLPLALSVAVSGSYTGGLVGLVAVGCLSLLALARARRPRAARA